MAIFLKDMQIDVKSILKAHGLEEGGKVQKAIDNQVLKGCEPYVPYDMGGRDYGKNTVPGALIKSGTLHTALGSGVVKYSTPYARRWYYEPADFQGAPMRGNYWFERYKQGGGIDEIKKLVQQLLKG